MDGSLAGEREIVAQPKELADPKVESATINSLGSAATQKSGRSINFSNENDPAVFVNKNYFSVHQIPRKYKSYKLQGKEEHVEKLLSEQKYTQALPYLWAERNLTYKIQWLESQRKKRIHPLLVLEHARYMGQRAILEKNKDKKYHYAVEAKALKALGVALVKADAKCIQDGSVQEISGFLSTTYRPSRGDKNKLDHILGSNFLGDENRRVKELLKECIEHLDRMASPIWTRTHALSVFAGTLPDVHPDGNWIGIRHQQLSEALRFVSVTVGKPKGE